MTVGRCEMTLGLNAKKKRALALPHLTEARRKVRNSGRRRCWRGSTRL